MPTAMRISITQDRRIFRCTKNAEWPLHASPYMRCFVEGRKIEPAPIQKKGRGRTEVLPLKDYYVLNGYEASLSYCLTDSTRTATGLPEPRVARAVSLLTPP